MTLIANKLIPRSLTGLPIRVYGRTASHWIRPSLPSVRGVCVRSRHRRPAGCGIEQQSKHPQVRDSLGPDTLQAATKSREWKMRQYEMRRVCELALEVH